MKKEDAAIGRAKRKLGKAIKRLRESKVCSMSQRQLASLVGLSPSNMKYIEDGVNAPTADVYQAIIDNLNPSASLRKEMDALYSTIRNTPPPDVCSVVCNNPGLNDALRLIDGRQLSEHQLSTIHSLFASFELPFTKGDTDNG